APATPTGSREDREGTPASREGPDLPPALLAAWRRRGQDPGAARDLSWLPAPLQAAWSKAGDRKPAMIVVDSWDAFVEEFADAAYFAGGPRPDRAQLERIVLRQVYRGTTHVVLVLERHEETQLDYLVNGIVEMRREDHDGNLERWLSLPKLRGVRIEFSSYPFTLEGARFQCITPVPGGYRLERVAVEPDPIHDASTLWPGSQDFETAFGRLPAGSATVIEVDPGVPEASYEVLVYPIMLNVLKKWGRVLLAPPPSLRLTDIWDTLRASIPEDVLNAQLRLISGNVAPDADHPIRKLFLPIPTQSSRLATGGKPSKLEEFMSERSSADVPNLIVLSADSARAIAGQLGREISPQHPPAIVPTVPSGAPLHTVFLASTGDPFVELVQNLAQVHLHLRDRLGRTFVYGKRPRTPGHVLTLRTDDRPYDLLRVV
ncbi:MAG: hypothetical protein L3J93_05360, partial [Thermoplasmata archaeon]|nr:hypothetical protein [Thermoplasmata archaeon]